MNENHDSLNQHAGHQFAYLTTTGRNSGNPHRIEIWFGTHDGRIFLMSGGRESSDWVKNLITDPNITIEIGEESFSGFATILSEPSEAESLARAILVQKYGTGRDLERWGKESLAIAIDILN